MQVAWAAAAAVPGRADLDARLFLVGALGAVGEALGAGIGTQGLERLLQLRIGHPAAQRHVTEHVDLEGGVVMGHGALRPFTGRSVLGYLSCSLPGEAALCLRREQPGCGRTWVG